MSVRSCRPSFGRKAIDRARVLAVAKGVIDKNDPYVQLLKQISQILLVSPEYVLQMFGDIDELNDAVSCDILLEICEMLSGAIERREGRDALEAYAQMLRAYGQAHPTLLRVALRPTRGSGDELDRARHSYAALLESVLEGYDLPTASGRELAACVGPSLEGFISAETSGRGVNPFECDRAFERLVDMLDHAVMTVAARESPAPEKLRSYG